MAKTTRKLAVRKETLRQLSNNQLSRVAGGLATGLCLAQDTRQVNSTEPSGASEQQIEIRVVAYP
jgi:hypothetical protein